MSRDKQIEEMAKDIRLNMQILPNPEEHPSHQMARLLVQDGYAKASELAEEIFAEIEKSIANLEYRANTPRKTVKVEELKAQVNWVLHEVVPQTLAELKKKYTEEGK